MGDPGGIARDRAARQLGAGIQVVVSEPVTVTRLKRRNDGCLKARSRCVAGTSRRGAWGDDLRLAAKGPRAGPEGVRAPMPGDSFPQRFAVLALWDVGWLG